MLNVFGVMMLIATAEHPRLAKKNSFVKWGATADEDGHYCFAVAL
jgi:hypothetical protein